jgi:hypothetical protein
MKAKIVIFIGIENKLDLLSFMVGFTYRNYKIASIYKIGVNLIRESENIQLNL